MKEFCRYFTKMKLLTIIALGKSLSLAYLILGLANTTIIKQQRDLVNLMSINEDSDEPPNYSLAQGLEVPFKQPSENQTT